MNFRTAHARAFVCSRIKNTLASAHCHQVHNAEARFPCRRRCVRSAGAAANILSELDSDRKDETQRPPVVHRRPERNPATSRFPISRGCLGIWTIGYAADFLGHQQAADPTLCNAGPNQGSPWHTIVLQGCCSSPRERRGLADSRQNCNSRCWQ
jgi:hypothetical protein